MSEKYVKIERSLFQNEKTKVYYLRCNINGQELRKSLGKVSLREAKRLKDQTLLLWNPDKKKGPLFDRLAYEVRELKQMRSRQTYENFECHLRLHLLPFFTGMAIRDVPKNWDRYRANEKMINPNRKLKHDREHLTFILRYAVRQGHLEGVPVLALDRRDRMPVIGREYSNDEIKRLLKTAKPQLRLKIMLQLNSGMRSGEVRQLRYDYIDFKSGLVSLPADITKTRTTRVYPLEPSILKELASLKDNASSEYVFPHRTRPGLPGTRTDKSWQRLKRQHGISGKQHWLRHTAVTRFIRSGLPGPLVQQAVGMSDQVMKRVYLHANQEDVKKMASVVKKSLKAK